MKRALAIAALALSARAQESIADVEEEFAMDEFFEGIEGDSMMLQIISDMNGLESFLATRNVSRSAETGEMEINEEEQDARTNQAIESLGGLKRFTEFKQLVSWLQPKDKRITRYCFYGCWCLPEGAHSFVAGTGAPVDLVDKSCQQLWFCYVCAGLEFKGLFSGREKICNPSKRRYRFKFRYDPAHPKHYDKRDIICKDNWRYPMTTKQHQRESCARAICECDRGAAFRLGRFWKHWDKERHRIWSVSVLHCARNAICNSLHAIGSADWDTCRAAPDHSCLFLMSERCIFQECGEAPGSECNNVDHEEICCGRYEDEGSRFALKDHGGSHACCNYDEGTGFMSKLPWEGKWYNVLSHCCFNGQVLNANNASC